MAINHKIIGSGLFKVIDHLHSDTFRKKLTNAGVEYKNVFGDELLTNQELAQRYGLEKKLDGYLYRRTHSVQHYATKALDIVASLKDVAEDAIAVSKLPIIIFGKTYEVPVGAALQAVYLPVAKVLGYYGDIYPNTKQGWKDWGEDMTWSTAGKAANLVDPTSLSELVMDFDDLRPRMYDRVGQGARTYLLREIHKLTDGKAGIPHYDPIRRGLQRVPNRKLRDVVTDVKDYASGYYHLDDLVAGMA